MALGVALFARAVDLPSVTSQALDAAWLALVGHVLCRTLLLRCADATESGAGTRRLDRLGGLIHRMPVTAGSCLVGLFAVAVLPPGLGFAAFWLLFQSLLAAARIGELGLQVLIVGVAALAALSVGLAGLAAVRLFGVVFLGVPRTPRAAVADDAPRPVRIVLGGLAAATALLGVLPGLALLPAAGWTRATRSMSLLILRTGAETPGLFAGCRWQGCSPWPGSPPCGYRAAPANSDASRRGPAVSPHRRHGCHSAIRRRSTGLLPSPRRCDAFWPCRRRSPRSMIVSVDGAKRCCALRRRWWHRGAIERKIDSVCCELHTGLPGRPALNETSRYHHGPACPACPRAMTVESLTPSSVSRALVLDTRSDAAIPVVVRQLRPRLLRCARNDSEQPWSRLLRATP